VQQLSLFDLQPAGAKTGAASAKPTATGAQSSSQVPEIEVIANFAALTSELLAADAEVFGGNIPADHDPKRARLIALFCARGTSLLEIGVALAEYKEGYKTRKQWVRAGEPLAKALGFKSVTSLNTLINDARLAGKLPKALLAALIEAGLEPTEHKYNAYINELIELNFSGGAVEARALVDETYTLFIAKKREAAQKKKKDKKAANNDSAVRLANQIASSLRNCSEPARRDFLETIIQQMNGKVRKLLPGCEIQLLRPTGETPEISTGLLAETATETATEARAVAPVESESIEVKSSEALVPLHQPAASAQTIPRMRLSPAFGPTATPLNSIVGCSLGCENCERCDSAESVREHFGKQFPDVTRKRKSGGILFSKHPVFLPAELYRVIEVKEPQIFVMPNCADLLDPALSRDVVSEHINVFRHAQQHLFVLETRNSDGLRELNKQFLNKYERWPPNLCMGVDIQYGLDLLATLRDTKAEMKWVDFSRWTPYWEYKPRSLDDDDMSAELKRSSIRWVKIGPETGDHKNLSAAAKSDLAYFITQAKKAECRVYVNRFETLQKHMRLDLPRYGEEWIEGKLRINEIQQPLEFRPARREVESTFKTTFPRDMAYSY
jgi:protein gp37